MLTQAAIIPQYVSIYSKKFDFIFMMWLFVLLAPWSHLRLVVGFVDCKFVTTLGLASC